MPDSEGDTSRTVVKTYIPAYQREVWDDHADRLDMSRSEFVRSMVQAGRRGFEGDQRPASPPRDRTDGERTETYESGGVPCDLESAVVESLSTDEFYSWDDVLAAVTDDIEKQVEEALQDLQTNDRVRYSGRNGGYTLEE